MRGFVTDCDCYLSDIVPLHVHVPSEADIFGVHSKLVTGETGMPQPIEQLSWVENYTYEGLVIAIFILFCYLLYNFRGDILQLLRFLAMHTSSEKIYAEQKLFFKRFINLSTLLGILLICGLSVKLCDYFGLDGRLPATGILNVNLIPVILLLLPGIILLYRYLVTGIVGAVTREPGLFQELPVHEPSFGIGFIFDFDSVFPVIRPWRRKQHNLLHLFDNHNRSSTVPALPGKELPILYRAECFNFTMDFVPLYRRMVPRQSLAVRGHANGLKQ